MSLIKGASDTLLTTEVIYFFFRIKGQILLMIHCLGLNIKTKSEARPLRLLQNGIYSLVYICFKGTEQFVALYSFFTRI